MEIKLKHVFYKELTDLTITFPRATITGLTGSSKETLFHLLSFSYPEKGTIYIGEDRKLKKNLVFLKRQIGYVEKTFTPQFVTPTIYQYFVNYIYYYQIKVESIEEKIKGALKIVGLTEKILEENMASLSSSEQKKLQLSLCFLSNPKVILLEEPFLYLDAINAKKLARILERLTDKFDKTIIIASDDSEVLYQYTNYLVVLKEGKVLVEGPTEDVYFDKKVLLENEISIPEIVSFITLVQEKKGIKLERRKDVKDTMKDIYRNLS